MLKQSANLFFKFVIGVLMCLFVFMSFSFAFTAAFSETVGYNVYHYNSELGREEIVCVHDAEDKNTTDCKCSDFTDELNHIRVTELSPKKEKVASALAQLFSIVLITGVIYGATWEFGNKDISNVKLRGKKENKFSGLIIGVIVSIPSILLFILLLLSKLEILKPEFLNTYRLLNSHFHGLLTLIFASSTTAAELSCLQVTYCGLLLLYLPLVCSLAYYLGYKDIKILEKFVYKKN